MAVNILRALVCAYYQSAWNRVRRESGLVGVATTAVTLGIVALIVVLGTGLMAVGRIWDRPLAYLALLGISILAYIRSLPMISVHFDRHQERLLRM